MNNACTWFLALVPLVPYTLEVDSSDQEGPSTILQIAVGAGSYADVTRDCSGNVLSVKDVPYRDVGASISHQVSVVKFGVSGGATNAPRAREFFGNKYSYSETPEYQTYITPTVGLNTRYVGLDVGWLFPGGRAPAFGFESGMPSGKLRLGRLDGTYFSVSVADNVPVFTGGGLVDVGLGFNGWSPRSRLWLGLAGGVDDGLMFSAKGDFPVSDLFSLTCRAHVAPSESFQYGLALGGKIAF